MAHCNFQPELQLGCVKEIIDIVRSGELDREKSLEVVEHVACFLGSGAAMLKGDGPEVFGSLPSDVADELESLIPDEGAPVAQAIPWISIARLLLPLLIDVLSKEEK